MEDATLHFSPIVSYQSFENFLLQFLMFFCNFFPASCITLSRGFYKAYQWWPGCTPIPHNKGIYACWFYIKINNNCPATPSVIYFNGCDKNNGFFRFLNNVKNIRVAKGPTLKYGDFASCSAYYTYPIKPYSTFYISYLMDVPKNLDWNTYKNWSPFDTWLWGVKW